MSLKKRIRNRFQQKKKRRKKREKLRKKGLDPDKLYYGKFYIG
jgi:hypothetical protein